MKKTKGRSIMMLILISMMFESSCFLGEPARHGHRQLLIDTSGSIPKNVFARIRANVKENALDWTSVATAGEKLTVSWLVPEKAAYPVDHRTWVMPRLVAPANRHRQRVAEQIGKDLDEVFSQMPSKVNKTRLLESIHFIASIQNSTWHLQVFSDLQQDSNRWESIRIILGNDEGKLVEGMLTLCPEVKVPPKKVSFITWPGLVKNKSDIQKHERDKDRFARFISEWAPEASLQIVSIN